MKKGKALLALGLSFAIVTGCSCSKSKVGYDDTYKAFYTYDAETLNYMNTNESKNSEVFASLVDGLVETDKYGSIKPALAESWSQDEEDGRVWTFNIREGVKWLKHNGTEYADVKAQDWVTSLKYALQSNEINYLITMFINNSQEYIFATEYAALSNDADRLNSTFFHYFADHSKIDEFAAAGLTDVAIPTVGENFNWYFGENDTGFASGFSSAEYVGLDAYEATMLGVDEADQPSKLDWFVDLKNNTEEPFYYNNDYKWVAGETTTPVSAATVGNPSIVWVDTEAKNAFDASYQYYLNFNNVGVKAVDDYTLQYTTYEVQSYFLSVLLHSAYYPANAEFIEEVGFDNFGSTKETMLYCGPHMLKVWDIESQVVLERNEKYWDVENVPTKTIKLIKYDSSNTTNYSYVRTQFESGYIDGFNVNQLDEKGWKKYVTGKKGKGTVSNPAHEDAYVTESEMGSQGSSFLLFFNRAFNYDLIEAYPAHLKTSLSRAEVEAGNKALSNINVRKALLYGLDRTYDQDKNWASDYENKEQYLVNMYTPKEFAIDENGKDYIEYYFEHYAEKKGVTLAQTQETQKPGVDGTTNLELARQYLATAKQQLLDAGLTLPVKLEYLSLPDADSVAYDEVTIAKWNDDLKVNGEQIIKIVRNTAVETMNQYSNGSNPYYATGHLLTMGWIPDFADPLTYLDTLTSDGAFAQMMGIHTPGLNDANVTEFERLVDVANAKSSFSERFEAFAEAEYYVFYEAALAMPWYIPGRGPRVQVSEVVPYEVMKGAIGCTANKYKYLRVRNSPLTQKERNELKAAYDAGKGK